MNRLSYADGVRGLAALWVVLFHASEGGHIDHLKGALPELINVAVFDWGHLGVAVFFVLSGFVMAHTVRKYDFTPAFGTRFMLRRLARLTPPYYASIIFVLAYVAGKAMFTGQPLVIPAFGNIAAHGLYLQDILAETPISVVYWTLCIEIQFYLAFIAMMLARRRVENAALISALAALPWAFGLVGPLYAGSFLPFWSSFMLGVLIGERFFWAYAVTLTIAGVFTGYAYTFASLAGATLIFAGSRFKGVAYFLNLRGVQFLGLVSYSLYLFHNQVSGGTDFMLKRALPGSVTADLIRLMIILIACVVIAYMAYKFVEQPSIDLSRRVRLGDKR